MNHSCTTRVVWWHSATWRSYFALGLFAVIHLAHDVRRRENPASVEGGEDLRFDYVRTYASRRSVLESAMVAQLRVCATLVTYPHMEPRRTLPLALNLI